jgi:chromate transporter
MHENNQSLSGQSTSRPDSLGSLFLTFLKIGSTAFGGFMALISVVQNYCVERRKLLKSEDMLDGISLATILPGPVAVNVVAYVGYRVRGIGGALVSVAAVILPSFLLLVGLTSAYFQYGHIPIVDKFFKGFVPAVVAIILGAGWNMAIKTIRGMPEAAISLGALGLLLSLPGFGVTLGIIAISAISGCLLFSSRSNSLTQAGKTRAEKKDHQSVSGPDSTNSVAAAWLPAIPILGLQAGNIMNLLTTFAGMSILLFGGGYVFIPLIQQIVVDGNGWVSRQEFIDAIALGQVTPGPILISAAFIGYKVAGISGALAATIGIFTPPAVLMVLCTRFLDSISRSKNLKAAMTGIRCAVIGMIVAAGFTLARSAPFSWVSLLIFGAALIALIRFKVETAWVIPAAGVAGLLLY